MLTQFAGHCLVTLTRSMHMPVSYTHLDVYKRQQQYGCHACRHSSTDGSHITTDEMHGIINTQTGIYRTARRIDIDGNILARDVYKRQGKNSIGVFFARSMLQKK